ncbi:hypothetical protein SY86_02260 [Erwinia tracheiphila]|uniref:Uncharacterized protein n=1 Tax=Erwinia tracheiphila TaxID=65700 RepID=A0A0M2KBD6_9GAMM|nr:hypothetical protein AV903_06155 [Erwinia tracheiphila]KKF34548.1 hypothetical protein SY86_02260 [Erwinia tracheiphila]
MQQDPVILRLLFPSGQDPEKPVHPAITPFGTDSKPVLFFLRCFQPLTEVIQVMSLPDGAHAAAGDKHTFFRS